MKAKEFYELQTHDSTCVVGRMDKEEIINLMDAFCDAEVERRIKERMPSNEDIQKYMEQTRYCNGEFAMDEQTFYEGAKWLRSRLTPQVTPQVEKKEGGNQ